MVTDPGGSTDSVSRSGPVKGQFVVVGDRVKIDGTSSIWNFVYIGEDTIIGENVTIGSLVHIGSNVIIGHGSQIEGSAYISDLSQIGDNCFIGPNVTLTNDAFPPVRRMTEIEAWEGVVVEEGAIVGGGGVASGVES